MSDFLASLRIAATGLHAQNARMRIIAENLANADSTGKTPEEDPYRRRIPTFKAVMDADVGGKIVEVGKVALDTTDFISRYEPGHPAAERVTRERRHDPGVRPEEQDAQGDSDQQRRRVGSGRRVRTDAHELTNVVDVANRDDCRTEEGDERETLREPDVTSICSHERHSEKDETGRGHPRHPPRRRQPRAGDVGHQ